MPTSEVLDALTKGVQQLQELQAQALQKGEASPEAIRQTIPPFPALELPAGDQFGLQLQDWLDLVSSNVADVSENSASWWEQVQDFVQGKYNVWLSSTPLERVQLKVEGAEHLAEGKWSRLNARTCALLLAALEEQVKQDLIARQATRSATSILMRLYVVYQPGGVAERTSVLTRLQAPTVGTTFEQALESVRAWPRWLRRCQEMGMSVPDGSVLAKGLSQMVDTHLRGDPDAAFRMQLVRSSLRMDGQPMLDQVKKYQEHLQSEMENLNAAGANGPSSKVRAMATTGASSKEGPDSGVPEGGKGDCRFFLKAAGCRRGAKCPFRHDLSSLTKQQRARKCLACGSEEHRQKDCPTRSSSPSRARSTQNQGVKSQEEKGPAQVAPQVQAQVVEDKSVATAGSGEAPSNASDASGKPVATLEQMLQVAAQVLQVPSASTTTTSSMRVLRVTGIARTRLDDGGESPMALLDSGATHA